MAKIDRFNGNVKAFGADAPGQERVIFGNQDSPPVQSDDLTDNMDANFFRGWGTLALGNKPPREWFNSAHFVATQLAAYLHQAGVPEYNVLQEYHKNSFANQNGAFILSLIDNNIGGDVNDNTVWANVGTVSLDTFTNLESLEPTVVGQRFECRERANAQYVLEPAIYTPQLGDVTFANGRVGSLAIDQVTNVKWFGAKGDNVTDDTTAIQNAIDRVRDLAAKPQGGGVVYLPKGIYRTNRVIDVYSDIGLVGDGKTQTYIKPLDSATFTTNQAVVQTVFFDTTQGTNLWDYYSPYPNGLIMGFYIDKICIDGNRGNVANAGGLYVYGGKWAFGDIGVINTAGHGIWTEAGVPGSSTSGDDLHDYLNMHESYAENVYICNADQHGWLYRGPNDSSVTDLQIKTCGWGGFYQESTGNNSVGNLEIQSLHAYACLCEHDPNGAMITFANVNAQFVYADASARRGVLVENSATIIDQLFVLGNDLSNGGFDAVTLDVQTQINMIRNTERVRTSGSTGTFLVVNAESIIGQLRTVKASGTTIVQKIIEINAPLQLGQSIIENYDIAGSVAIDLSTQRCDINAQIRNCETGIEYNQAGRNSITLNAFGNVTDIDNVVSFANSDIFTYLTDKQNLSQENRGRSNIRGLSISRQDIGFSASITPQPREYSSLKVAVLTGNITINAPTDPEDGDLLRLQFQQDGTGGRTISWDPIFQTNYSDSGNTSFQRASIEFYYDGSFWVQNYFSGWL